MNIKFNVQNMQMQMGPMPVDLQMMDYEPHYPPRGPTSPDPPLDQTPVPILFERVAQGLREGDYHLVYEVLAQVRMSRFRQPEISWSLGLTYVRGPDSTDSSTSSEERISTSWPTRSLRTRP